MKQSPLLPLSLLLACLSCAHSATRGVASGEPSRAVYSLRCGTRAYEVMNEEIKKGSGEPTLVQHSLTFRPLQLSNESVETRIGDRAPVVSVKASREACQLQYPLQALLDGARTTTFRARLLSFNFSGGLAFTPYAPSGSGNFLKAELGIRYPQIEFSRLGAKEQRRGRGISKGDALRLEAIPSPARGGDHRTRVLHTAESTPLLATLNFMLMTGIPTEMAFGTEAEPLRLKILAEIEHDPQD